MRWLPLCLTLPLGPGAALPTVSPVLELFHLLSLTAVLVEAQTIHGARQGNVFKSLLFPTGDLSIPATKIFLEPETEMSFQHFSALGR